MDHQNSVLQCISQTQVPDVARQISPLLEMCGLGFDKETPVPGKIFPPSYPDNGAGDLLVKNTHDAAHREWRPSHSPCSVFIILCLMHGRKIWLTPDPARIPLFPGFTLFRPLLTKEADPLAAFRWFIILHDLLGLPAETPPLVLGDAPNLCARLLGRPLGR